MFPTLAYRGKDLRHSVPKIESIFHVLLMTLLRVMMVCIDQCPNKMLILKTIISVQIRDKSVCICGYNQK